MKKKIKHLSLFNSQRERESGGGGGGERLLRISSDGDYRRIFLGLKCSILGFFSV